MASGKLFETSNKKGSARVYVTEDNKIKYINTHTRYWDTTKCPSNEGYFLFLDEVFKMMMSQKLKHSKICSCELKIQSQSVMKKV